MGSKLKGELRGRIHGEYEELKTVLMTDLAHQSEREGQIDRPLRNFLQPSAE